MNQMEVMKLNRSNDGITLIVKPTNDCNLNCKYCYDKPIRHAMSKTRMSLEVFEHAVALMNMYSKRVNILWHGGEATLMGHEFYYKANEILSKYYTTEFTQQMQTNGTLVHRDPQWIQTFKDCGISPGTSYDATYQYMREGTEEDTMREVMEMLSDADLGGKGGITIIHNENLHRMIEMYEYIKQEFGGDFGLCFNLGFMTDETQDKAFNLDPNDIYTEFVNLYNHMISDSTENALMERNYERNVRGLIKSHQGKGCELIDCRSHWITVVADGTLIPCSRFSIYHTFGNIMDYTNIEDVLSSDGFTKYCHQVDERHERLCGDCKIYDKCMGGCPAKFARNSITPEITQCEFIKAQFLASYQSLQSMDINSKLNRKAISFMTRYHITHPYHIFRYLEELGISSSEYSLDTTGLDVNRVVSTKIFRIVELFNKIDNRNYYLDPAFSLTELYDIVKPFLESTYTEIKPLVEDILNE